MHDYIFLKPNMGKLVQEYDFVILNYLITMLNACYVSKLLYFQVNILNCIFLKFDINLVILL